MGQEQFASELLTRAQKRFQKGFKDNQHNHEAKKIKTRIQAIDGQLDALAERLSTIPANISAVPIFKQMEILQDRKTELETAYLNSLDGFYPRDLPIEFEDLKKLTIGLKKLFSETASPEVKTKIIQKLVAKIEIGIDSVRIHFIVGKESLRSLIEPRLLNLGSNSLTNGARRGT